MFDTMLVVANSDDEESYIVPTESIGLRLRVREDGHRTVRTDSIGACWCPGPSRPSVKIRLEASGVLSMQLLAQVTERYRPVRARTPLGCETFLAHRLQVPLELIQHPDDVMPRFAPQYFFAGVPAADHRVLG